MFDGEQSAQNPIGTGILTVCPDEFSAGLCRTQTNPGDARADFTDVGQSAGVGLVRFDCLWVSSSAPVDKLVRIHQLVDSADIISRYLIACSSASLALLSPLAPYFPMKSR
jgi:hypothetical protein